MASWSLMIQVKFLGVMPLAHFPLTAIVLMLPSVRRYVLDARCSLGSCRRCRGGDRAGHDPDGLDRRLHVVGPNQADTAGQGPCRGRQRGLEAVVDRSRFGFPV